MFFKKKRMIDISELQEKGFILNPGRELEMHTDKDGFVDVTKNDKKGFLGLKVFSKSGSAKLNAEEFYDKREVDAKLQALDNMIYKLEQRIEVLERKTGVNNSGGATTSTGGLIGW